MQKERFLSVDVLRGLTIMLMTLVNNPGSWSHIYAPLEHAAWHGCTPTDLVFPFFIFIMGVAIPLAMPNRIFNQEVFIKIVTRSLRIFCLGFFFAFFGKIELFGLEGYPLLIIRLGVTAFVAYLMLGNFSSKTKLLLAVGTFALFMGLSVSGIEAFSDTRILGVLQRIAICYFFASLVYLNFNSIQNLIIIGILLLGYWGAMTLIPVPGYGVSSLEPVTNLSNWLDAQILRNHVYKGDFPWDPEGILSTIPAIAQAILGAYIGIILSSQELTTVKRASKIALYGFVMVVLGLVWDQFFPINKKIWTSSYVLFTVGLASIILAFLYYVIDIAKKTSWTQPIVWWGVNPMIVFFMSGIIPRVLSNITVSNPEAVAEEMGIQSYIYKYQLVPFFQNEDLASLVWALSYIAFWFVLVWIFYRKKWIFKV